MSRGRAEAGRTLRTGRPVPLSAIIGHNRRGPGDPTHRRIGTGWLRASRTPDGPVLLKLAPRSDGVRADAWGPGARWSLEQLPRLVGVHDDPASFRPLAAHPPLVEAVRRFGVFRIGATDLVFEAVAPACLEQVVTGMEAFRAFRMLVTEYGEPAPGPTDDPGSAAYGMKVPPPAEVWARIPSWKFLAVGVEQRRSRTLVRAATRGVALERTVDRSAAEADVALRSLPGIGPWTSAEVRQRAHGDADAWSIGDFHVGRNITWALTGEQLDDDACTELLEPYRGHRFRVQQLLGLMGLRPPRRAPRMTLPTHTPYATRGRS